MNRSGFPYLRMVAAELFLWTRGWRSRTRERVIHEYTGWRVNLSSPVLAIHPDGRLERLTVGEVRRENWQRILDGLVELGVRKGNVLDLLSLS